MNIVLRQKTDQLEEQLVVVGYGAVRRKDLTGSVGSANVTDMQKAPVISFEEALSGRVAGVQVTSADGQPGADISVVIRGNNSVTQDNSPLYVIDGFPMENPNTYTLNPRK
ncbi:TonB-dependent receptor plug domain-containing protein [Niabella sp. W65]|nr:TonB-dependent receptor plug domain-containing protein [Niabella sp. W65]MCH7365129.1 TonB-dependent receptor plug domain-containing protein [Niabella sp. W65]ULT40946.1 TonB-dependent receptor plug domain-containing protein [Niabella sp. I65]